MIAEFREVCWVCRRARRVCLCGVIAKVKPAAKVVFLQHPREARNVVGTVRIAHLVLEGSVLFEGIEMGDEQRVQELFEKEAAHSAVIYPTADARPAEELAAREGPLTLWLIDGTWSQARKMWRSNPWLHQLPAYKLNPTVPGNYRIRKEPAAHCLATIEAVSQVLDLVAGQPGRHDELIKAFDAMVERQLGFVHTGGGRQRLHKKKKHRTVKLPEGFSPDNVVLVHCEGNGWPVRSDKHRLLELHLERPRTGETKRLLVRGDVEPHEVAVKALAADMSRATEPADVRAALEAFIQPGDWCVGWGRHAPSLLEPHMQMERFFDLKPAIVDFVKKRLGYVEDAAERLGLPKREEISRTDRRARSLRAVFDRYAC